MPVKRRRSKRRAEIEPAEWRFLIDEPSPEDRAGFDREIGANAFVSDPRQPGKYESGGGGLLSTTGDYTRFLQMMVNGGSLDGKRYLSPKTVAYMTSDHMGEKVVPGPLYIPGDGYGFGLGFAVRKSNGVAGAPGTEGDYSWGGAAATFFWVDPKERMFVVFMMQAPKQRGQYPRMLKNMIYAAFERSAKPVPLQD